MTATLNGQDYRARRRLSDKANVTLADVGHTCERVPAASLPALLASGKIELVVERRGERSPAAARKPGREKR